MVKMAKFYLIFFFKKKFDVYCLVKKKPKIINRRFKYITNDLKSKKKIFIQLKKIKPNIVIHLASVNHSFSQINKNDNYKINFLNNFEISKNLIDALLKAKLKSKFVFAGSALMYEGTEKKIINEDEKFDPISNYSKYKVETYNYIKKKKIKFYYNNFI